MKLLLVLMYICEALYSQSINLSWEPDSSSSREKNSFLNKLEWDFDLLITVEVGVKMIHGESFYIIGYNNRENWMMIAGEKNIEKKQFIVYFCDSATTSDSVQIESILERYSESIFYRKNLDSVNNFHEVLNDTAIDGSVMGRVHSVAVSGGQRYRIIFIDGVYHRVIYAYDPRGMMNSLPGVRQRELIVEFLNEFEMLFNGY